MDIHCRNNNNNNLNGNENIREMDSKILKLDKNEEQISFGIFIFTLLFYLGLFFFLIKFRKKFELNSSFYTLFFLTIGFLVISFVLNF